ncbi:hypothetical protein VP01_253g1 [Puccinia sorghi]|uniref:Uncharacterized protein n=1 Tax=Puccinia sorghi TaxID=27349 RepID=A0A0L6V568_9BASI|nr:hypothetical protein VP01_253g1 [Puccinia sorghi]
MASHSDLLAIKIHPRFQDERLCLAIKLMIIIIIVTTIYKWSENLKTPYNNSKTTGAKYIHFLLTGRQSLTIQISPWRSSSEFSCILLAKVQLTDKHRITFNIVVKQSPKIRNFHLFLTVAWEHLMGFTSLLEFQRNNLRRIVIGKGHSPKMYSDGNDLHTMLGCSFYLADAGYSLMVFWYLIVVCGPLARATSFQSMPFLQGRAVQSTTCFSVECCGEDFWRLEEENLNTHPCLGLQHQNQFSLVFSLEILHNFSINHGNVESNDFFNLGARASTEAIQLRRRDKQLLQNWRDGIAEDMWAQHQEVLSACRSRHRRAN